MKPTRLSLLVAVLFLPALAPFSVLAQVVPTVPYGSGSALKDVQPPQTQVPTEAPKVPVIVEPEVVPMSLPSGQTLMVRDFRIEGSSLVPEADVQAALQSVKGKALSLAQIEAAADMVTALYRARGYLLAGTYVPKQDARDGVLTLRVLVGKPGKVFIRNNSLVEDDSISEFLAPLSSDEVVTRDRLERAMMLVGDLPGAKLPNVSIAPGEAPGSADLGVQVPAGRHFNAYAYVDNYGARYTGKDRLAAGIDINSPLGFGDRLSFGGLTSEESGLQNTRAAWSVPLNGDGLRLDLVAARTTYDLGDVYRVLDATGTATTADAVLSWPWLRGREESLTLSLDLAAKRLSDKVGAVGSTVDKSSRLVTAGVRYERFGALFGRSASVSVNGGVTVGHLDFNDPTEAAANRAGADTAGNFGKFNLFAQGSVALTQDLNLRGSLAWQQVLNNKNLDGSEQLSISGTSGVMAYEQTLTGDNGYLANLELRQNLPGVGGWSHALGLFVDAGYTELENGDYSTVKNNRAGDWGLGYYANYKKFFLRLQMAQGIGGRPSGDLLSASRTRGLAQAGFAF